MPDDQMIERPARLFQDWLAQQRRGALSAELTEALNRVADGVREHGKAGSLTLKVTIKPAGKGSERAVLVTDDVILKVPAGQRGEAIWFVDDEGALSRSDPDAMRLPFPAPLRDVSDSTPAPGATAKEGSA